jgi:hypothetical protein
MALAVPDIRDRQDFALPLENAACELESCATGVEDAQ